MVLALALGAVAVGPGFTVGAGIPIADTQSVPTNATIASAYPNPVARGDPGEFVAIHFDVETNTSGWTLTDGKTTAVLPARTYEGTVAFSMDPDDARADTKHPVEPLDGRLLLADDGDRLELRAGNETVSTARYRNAPVSKIRDFESNAWRPVGATSHEPIRTDGGSATAFVLPDSPDRTVSALESAEDRLYVAGYTFTSDRLTDVLIAAERTDVDVRLLLDGSPVGGVTDRQARQLDRLIAADVAVRLLSGSHTRYRHHHPKYAVVDGSVLVTTENFKPAGTGGMSSRGWGVVLEDEEVADGVADVHESDWTWRAATPWEEYRAGRSFAAANPALGAFDTRHDPESITFESSTVLVAPDNADDELLSIVDSADDRVLLQQVRIDSRENGLLRAVLRAADRGVRVRILLDGSWYVEDDNAELVTWLNRRAEAEDWDLEARIDTPDGYEKIHTKGVIVDETVVVGSLNWVRSAKSENREVLVVLQGPEPADYYASVFEADWRDGHHQSLPVGLLAAAAVSASIALLVLNRLQFVGRKEVVTDWQW